MKDLVENAILVLMIVGLRAMLYANRMSVEWPLALRFVDVILWGCAALWVVQLAAVCYRRWTR